MKDSQTKCPECGKVTATAGHDLDCDLGEYLRAPRESIAEAIKANPDAVRSFADDLYAAAKPTKVRFPGLKAVAEAAGHPFPKDLE